VVKWFALVMLLLDFWCLDNIDSLKITELRITDSGEADLGRGA